MKIDQFDSIIVNKRGKFSLAGRLLETGGVVKYSMERGRMPATQRSQQAVVPNLSLIYVILRVNKIYDRR
jgi:hypothetical protein